MSKNIVAIYRHLRVRNYIISNFEFVNNELRIYSEADNESFKKLVATLPRYHSNAIQEFPVDRVQGSPVKAPGAAQSPSGQDSSQTTGQNDPSVDYNAGKAQVVKGEAAASTLFANQATDQSAKEDKESKGNVAKGSITAADVKGTKTNS